MKIVFVYPAFESLASEYLSAVAKSRGHDTAMVFDPRLFADSFLTIGPLARLFSMEKKVVREVVAHKPDLIAFSVVTNDYPWFERMAGVVRGATGAPIIAGNIHITSAPEYVLKSGVVDAVVRGEGEQAFADVLDSLENGALDASIPNLGVMENGAPRLNPLRPLIADLDSLPFTDKTLYSGTPIRAGDVYTIMATRGCPFKCSFCNKSLMKKLYGARGYVRSRSVDNVIEELRFALKNYEAKRVNFYDEVLGVEKKWLEEFAEKYTRDIKLPYIACTNPNVVTDEYADLLARSGCIKIDLGVQTINEQKRREVYHRRETNEQIRATISRLRSRGIRVAAENIVNFPGETESDLVEMARFYNEMRPEILKVFWLRYYPGTEIIDIAVEKGVLNEQDVRAINEGRDIGSVTMGGRVPKLQRKFYPVFALSQVLPPAWVETILKKRLYRFFPSSFLPRFSYTVYRFLTRESKDEEMMLHQHASRYIHYIKKRFTG